MFEMFEDISSYYNKDHIEIKKIFFILHNMFP